MSVGRLHLHVTDARHATGSQGTNHLAAICQRQQRTASLDSKSSARRPTHNADRIWRFTLHETSQQPPLASNVTSDVPTAFCPLAAAIALEKSFLMSSISS